MLRGFCGFVMDEEGHELLPHGTEDFPCVGYAEEHSDDPADVVPWHWHNDFEAIEVCEGTLRVNVPGGSFLATEGDGVFVNAGVMHQVAGEPWASMRDVVFSPLLVCGTYDSVFSTRYVGPLAKRDDFTACALRVGTDDDALACLRRGIEALAEERVGYEFVVRHEMSDLLLDMLARADVPSDADTTGGGIDAARIKAMCDYVDEHYREDVRVGDLAAAAGVGERECLRCFRRSIGMTPSHYLLYTRMVRAATILANDPAVPVAEVGRAVGVASPSNFARLFRKDFRCSPSEYRSRASASHGGEGPRHE
ncbi:MAG: AraC family transcriptional regulator [Atopobiaceae bacterium]|jgi:AraC-like DNA-binding protein|nr:AraC family transcriptional regulator [Atopobiaceae bacterium]MCI2172785.1 AraC family transcriptional regulator [Atopobiaceae bacterium]MCI2207092.1 AraC family transcriptional regulator [Atopobiaceae bacterium]